MGKWILLLVFTTTLAFVEGEDCPCAYVESDSDYATAVSLLDDSIARSGFYGGEMEFPFIAYHFYPPKKMRTPFCQHYPIEGQFEWKVIKRRVRTDLETPATPIKILRSIHWKNKSISIPDKIFVFVKDYTAILQAFQSVKNDIDLYYKGNVLFIDARINDLNEEIDVFEWGSISERYVTEETLFKIKKEKQELYQKIRDRVLQKEQDAIAACTRSLDFCIEHHHNPTANLNRGMFHYLDGNTLEALDQVYSALQRSKNDLKKLHESALFLKGQSELEIGLYANAILTLTDLITLNPAYQDAYCERAHAYFELGNFDLSLEDYLASEIKPENPFELTSFSLGITKGILQGGLEAGIEYIPSLLSSLQGLSQGLWAFAKDPVKISTAFVEASKDCINFIKEHTTEDIVAELAPELNELLKKWDSLDEAKKGEITGHVIGKYGVEIFSGFGITKAMKSYRELKRANNLLTFEAMALSERNQSAIKLEAAKRAQIRKDILQKDNLKIEWDKQGKHLEGHTNFQLTRNRSILVHPDPQKLIHDFSGKGTRANSITPGSSGYQEIVDFKEFIGYSVHPDTGEKIATSWGKIHYSKEGVHLVPVKPR